MLRKRLLIVLTIGLALALAACTVPMPATQAPASPTEPATSGEAPADAGMADAVVLPIDDILVAEPTFEARATSARMLVVIKAMPGVGRGPTRRISTPMEQMPAARAFSIM